VKKFSVGDVVVMTDTCQFDSAVAEIISTESTLFDYYVQFQQSGMKTLVFEYEIQDLL
jgi:hypothetical protein